MTVPLRSFTNRLPDFRSIVLVFSVISLVFYGWTFVSIAWKLNSWAMNLLPEEIGVLICNLMVLSFLESIAVVLTLLVFSLLLPQKALKDKFVVRGSILVLCVFGSMGLHLKLHADEVNHLIARSLELWWLLTSLLAIVLMWYLPRLHATEPVIREFADRTTVFLYLFLPITAIGLLVMALRGMRVF
jgi:hypothetical protein